MATRLRLEFPFRLLLFLFCSPPLFALEGIREIDLRLDALTFDHTGRHLYGASGQNLLQIDAESGTVLRTFDLQSRIFVLETGAGRSLWVGQDKAIRRFDTASLLADDPIVIPGPPIALSPSPSNPNLVAVTVPGNSVPNSGAAAAAFIVRDGLLLPDWQEYRTVGLHGNTVFGSRGSNLSIGGVFRSAIGPNGILHWDRHLVEPGGGEYKSLGNFLYNQAGLAIDATTSAVYFSEVGGGFPCVNPDTSSIFFFSLAGNRWTLNRFAHPVFRLSGHFSFPPNSFSFFGNVDLAAWSSNRVVINGANKLYLLDTDRLFLPSDLALTHALLPDPPLYGQPFTFAITLTNRGPGAAINISVTNPAIGHYRVPLLEPGETHEKQFSLFPRNLGYVTTTQAAADNEATPADNLLSTTINFHRPLGPVTRISLPTGGLAVDPAADRLYILSNHEIRSINLTSLALSDPASGPIANYKPITLDLHNDNGFIYFIHIEHPQTFFGRLELATGQVERMFSYLFTSQPIPGLVGSPSDPNLVAVSDVSGTYLVKNGNVLPDHPTVRGEAAFSPDGSKLYFMNPVLCQLEIYRVVPSGLALDHTFNQAACPSFTVFDDRIYFNNGRIYDPATRQEIPSGLSFSPPSFVLPRSNDTLDVLTRVDGTWILRRFTGAARELQITVPLPELTSIPAELIAAAPNITAIRAGSPAHELLLVDLAYRGPLPIRVTRVSSSEATLIFPSARDSTYRIERANSLNPPDWAPVKNNLPGNGGDIRESVLLHPDAAAFYRVARITPQ